MKDQDFNGLWGESGMNYTEYQSFGLANYCLSSNPSQGNRMLTRKHRKSPSLDKYHEIWG